MSDPAPAFYGSVAASGGTGDISLGAALPGHADLKTAVDIGVDHTGGGLPADRTVDYLIRYGNAREWGVGVVRVDGRFSRTAIAGTVENGVADTDTPGPLDIAAGALITWEQVGPDRTFGRLTAERDIVINGAPDATKLTVLRTDNVARWQYGATVEDAGGDGGDFAIYRYGNDGAFLGTGLLIRRASGNILTGAELNAGGLVSQDGDIWLRNIDPGADFQTLHSVIFQGFNTAGGLRSYGAITSVAVSAASGAENGRIDLNVVDNGVMTQKINVTADGVTVKDNVVINGTVTADAFTNNSANDALSIVGGTDPATSGTIQLFGENTVFDQIDFYPEGTGTGPALRMRNTDSTFSGSVTAGRLITTTTTTGGLLAQYTSIYPSSGARGLNIRAPETDDQNAPFIFETPNAITFRIDATDAFNLTSSGDAIFSGSVSAGAFATTNPSPDGANWSHFQNSSATVDFGYSFLRGGREILTLGQQNLDRLFALKADNAGNADVMVVRSTGAAQFAGTVSAGGVICAGLYTANAFSDGIYLSDAGTSGTRVWRQYMGFAGGDYLLDDVNNAKRVYQIHRNAVSVQQRVDALVVTDGGIKASGTLGFTRDGWYDVGAPGARASVIFAVTGTINTSDARLKTPFDDLTDTERAALLACRQHIGLYRWRDAVAAKGMDGARRHCGVTAQTCVAEFEARGLDPWAYAFFCRDAVPVMETRTVTRQEDRPVTEPRPVTRERIDIVDGRAVLTHEDITEDVPLYDDIPLTDGDGNPVMETVDVPSPTDTDPHAVETVTRPRTHRVPVMERVEITEDIEVEATHPDGTPVTEDRHAIRYDQLILAMLAAGAADVPA